MSSGHIGVDIGGTTITCARFENDVEPVEVKTFLRKNFVNPDQWFEEGVPDAWISEQLPWVLGIPGSVLNRETIGSTPNLSGPWSGPLLLDTLSNQPFTFQLENDANLAALGEATFGTGEDYDHVILLTLGTGIGGGLVFDGNIHHGGTGLAGEVGHLTLEPGGRPCGCGDVGCFEQYGSATGLRKTYQELGGSDREAKEIVQRMDQEVTAREAVRQTGWALGKGVALLINLLEPGIILFSGGLARSLDRFLPAIMEARNNHLFAPEAQEIPLKVSELDYPALLGTKALIAPAS